jgi:hypothetical protein
MKRRRQYDEPRLGFQITGCSGDGLFGVEYEDGSYGACRFFAGADGVITAVELFEFPIDERTWKLVTREEMAAAND